MRQRATRMSGNAHSPLKTLAALIAAMFAATSAPAFIYEASDLSTQYQDSIGTLPVTAVEQPVGLILDKSKGAVRGAENVTNPGAPFNAATGWVTNGTLSVVGGKLRCTATATGAFRATFAPTSVAGRTYEVKIAVAASTVATQTGAWQFSTATGVYATTTASTAARTSRFIITPPTSPFYIGVTATAANIGDYFEIESASSREIPGNHLIQPTPPSRPILTARVNLLTYSEQIGHANWVKSAGGTGTAPAVTDNFGAAPDGTTTAARVQLAINGGTTTADISRLLQPITNLPVGGTYSQGLWLKTNDGTTKVVQFRDDNSATVGKNITVTGAWQYFSQDSTVSAGSTTVNAIGLWCRGGLGTADSADLLMWHPQFNYGAPVRYQRIGAATDYDTVGFAKGWRFDGTDDGMYTAATLNLSTTNKIAITAAVQAFDTTGTRILMEQGGAYTGATGRFELAFGEVSPGAFVFARRTATPNNNYRTEFTQSVPRKTVVSVISNGDDPQGIQVRGDGTPTTRAVSGPDTLAAYTNEVMYVARRQNVSNPMSCIVHSIRGIGRLPSPDELGWLEAQARLDMNNNL